MVLDDASVQLMADKLAKARSSGAGVTYDGVSWLGAKVANSIALSPIAFVQARAAAPSKADRPFIGFADPRIVRDARAFARVKAATIIKTSAATDYCAPVREALLDLPPLPNTATEVETVAASFGAAASQVTVGPAFTDSAIVKRGSSTGDLTHYKVVYFATHGILPPPNGCVDPALVTSLGDGASDGLLDVNKIQDLRLDADLVVLSACDTGRNSGGDSDAVGGLVQTFVQAGARNLLVSNWSVDTVATERLMIDMFKATGKSQSEALSDAQRALIANPRYSHPFYWASFVVVGDGARPMPSL
jgi:CHAT domain-containing protein